MKLGVLGGSGLYRLEGLEAAQDVALDTPFGTPSDRYVTGTLGGCEVAFLARHGQGHRHMPSEINYRANIHGFKQLGIKQLVSISAVGSLQETYRPRDILLPDQYFDRTQSGRSQTFFGDGIVAHVPFGNPVCAALGDCVEQAVADTLETLPPDPGAPARRCHRGGTYVNMQGPAFSTRAESNYYRAAGFDIIGMTSLYEAKLCREAGLCYQPICMVTDYDCWHASEATVTLELILANLAANITVAAEVLRRLCPALSQRRPCDCATIPAQAVVTQPDDQPEAARHRLRFILGSA